MITHAANLIFIGGMIRQQVTSRECAMFGDPGFRGSSGMMGRFMSPFPATLEAKLKENCAAGDQVSIDRESS